MKLIEPSVELVGDINPEQILKHIELCGRVSHQSEPRENSAENFVRMLIKRGHESVLEHVSLTFHIICDRAIMAELTRHRHASFCVTGDTVIPSYSSTPHCSGKKRTIEEIYNWSQDARCQAAFKALVIRSFDEETHTIVPNKIRAVFFNGVQDVFEVKTESGRTIKCTKGHRFFTTSGWKCLRDIDIGDSIYSNGKELLENEDWIRHNYLTLNKTRKQVACEIGCCESTLYKAFQRFGIFKPWSDRPNRQPGHGVKGMFSAEQKRAISIRKSGKNNPGYKLDRETLSISGGYREAHKLFDSIEKTCEICGATKSVEIHHLDKNPKNNSNSNIKFLCSKCHHLWHRPFAIGAFADKVIEIVYAGKEKVYDLEMESPYHNYVANGIVVHNSVESTRYVKYDELTFIKSDGIKKWEKPDGLNWETTHEYDLWYQGILHSEIYYKSLLDDNLPPEQARAVLPNCLKSELYMTANLRSWRHILKLRTDKAAHPQMRHVAGMILDILREKLPVIVEDIEAN